MCIQLSYRWNEIVTKGQGFYFWMSFVDLSLFTIPLFQNFLNPKQNFIHNIATVSIYVVITKNICWNRGFWCSLNNTYPIFLTLCIRCTNHLCDSCDLTDVNPHFIPSLLRMIQNFDLLWRHRYKSRPPAIVTSQWSIVPAWSLWTLFSTMEYNSSQHSGRPWTLLALISLFIFVSTRGIASTL